MSMEEVTCPECGAPVGGWNHEGVAEVERARMAVRFLEQELENLI